MRKDSFLNPVFIVHIVLHIFAYALAFLVDWRIVVAIAILLYLQEIFVGGCILTMAQYGRKNTDSYLYPYLIRIGIKVDKKKINFYYKWIEESILIIIALIWQVVLGQNPILDVYGLISAWM